MADQKISQLTAVTTLNDTDEFVLARSGTTRKIVKSDLQAEIGNFVLFDSTLGADAASIDSGAGGFATTLALLEIFVIARTTEAAVGSSANITFNNDTGANYARGSTVANGGGFQEFEDPDDNALLFGCPGASAAAGIAGLARIVVPGYGGTTFHKAFELVGGYHASSWQVQVRQGRWASTSAISRVILNAGSGDLLAGSRLTVIGRG